MANTKIEWTDRVWNPITGCSPISLGCEHCYAKRFATRLAGRCGYPADDPFCVTFHPDRLYLPLHWTKPQKIFVNSMGDIFHDRVKPSWVDEVLEVIAATPQHTYQILTKRAVNIENKLYECSVNESIRNLGGGDYLPNLWLGVTVENAKYKDRIDTLRTIPAMVRFISCEPLLDDVGELDLTGIHWVIVGGETGPGARPMLGGWAFDILKQCQQQNVPFFFKKWGPHYPKANQDKIRGRIWREFPKDR
jgi:protein gp37